jgi:hypothetical protein
LDATAACAAAAVAAVAASLADPAAAAALVLHAEPANALSLPTWAVHTSSVMEWCLAMALSWRYAEVARKPAFKALAWGMAPSLAAAMCACTWHFFYNSDDLKVSSIGASSSWCGGV